MFLKFNTYKHDDKSKTDRIYVQISVQGLHTSVQGLHTSMQGLHTFFLLTAANMIFVEKVCMAKKRDMEKIRQLAWVLYLNGEQGKDIAEKVGVSAVTISRWIRDNNWRELRAAHNVTRPELVNKLLAQIDSLLVNAAANDDPTAIAGLADKLSKLASVVEKLDKRAGVVDSVEVFMTFNKWLESRSSIDKELTVSVRQKINRLQDLFVNEQMNM